MDLYIAVDVGATYTRVGIGSKTKLLDKVVLRTPRSGDENTIAEAIIHTVRKHYGKYLDEVRTVGVASIGPLDIRRGRVVGASNAPIREFELLHPLKERLGKPVYVLNDAVAGVYGEKYYGAGRGYSNIVYITISTGVGGGVIVDDHLLIGKQGNAHEIGHIVVKYDSDVKCGCGGVGHWEAYAGGANIPRLAKLLAEKHGLLDSPVYTGAVNGEITAREVFEYYRRGDKLARITVNEVISACIAGFASVINSYDPEIITIGGSVFLNNQDVLLAPIVRGVEEQIITGKPVIKPTPLGGDVVLYGALALAVNPPPHLVDLQGS